MDLNFSVLMSVYVKENPQFLSESLISIFNQTVLPTEVVLVKDGLLTKELDEVIEKFTKLYNQIKVVELPSNVGLGEALNIGLKNCSFEIVARMDSDDYCRENRFETQINFLSENPNVALVGSNISEFFTEVSEIASTKKMPLDSAAILKYSRKRNPFNHPSVMFKKSVVEEVGNYMDMPYFEDYFLWLRVINNGYETQNINKDLVLMRANENMFRRRGGWYYFKCSLKFRKKVFSLKYIGFGDFVFLTLVQLLNAIVPNSFRIFMYKKVLRH